MGANFKKGKKGIEKKIEGRKSELIFVIFIIVIYLAIFVLSSQGILETRKMTRVVENSIIAKYLMPWKVGTLYLSVRQWAHIYEYFFLGVAVQACVLRKNIRKVPVGLLLLFLFSILDQMHKMIVPGREFDIFDLILDCVGYTFGTVLVVIILLVLSRKNKVV